MLVDVEAEGPTGTDELVGMSVGETLVVVVSGTVVLNAEALDDRVLVVGTIEERYVELGTIVELADEGNAVVVALGATEVG